MDERRFEVKCRLTAEEVVLFDRIRDQNGLGMATLARMYIKEGMARDSIHLAPEFVGNTPKWDGNVRPFRSARGTQ